RMWHRRCSSAPATVRDGAMGSHQEVPMDQQKVEALAFRMVADMAASFSMALGHIGDRLGLFRAMKGAGPLTSEQLALKTRLNERYVREWLKAMVAAEYLDYEPTSGQYVMTPEQASVLADDASPMSAGGPLQFTAPTVANTEKLVRIFRDGGGISYSEIGPEVPEGIARFFGPGYVNFLVQEWLPAVSGLPDDGVFLWSEPNASDNPLENRHPVGKAFQCVSPLHCMTVSLAHRGEGLGTVIGERGVRALGREAGFSHVEKLPIQNPFNQFFVLRA